MSDKEKVGLKKVEITFPDDSVEARLVGCTPLNRAVLNLEHSMFTMRFDGDDLYFDMMPTLARLLYHADITREVETSISYIDFILSPCDDDSFGNVSAWAQQMSRSHYEEDNEDWQLRLMSHICYHYFMAKFSNVNNLNDITRPVPTALFINILSKQKDVEVAYMNREGYLYAGRIKSIKVVSTWVGSYISLRLAIITKGKDGYVNGLTEIRLKMVDSALKLEDIGLMPMTPELKAQLTERGRKYVKYTEKPAYCFHEGFGFRYGGWFGDVRLNIRGRVMVDIAAMRALNSNISDSWYIGNPFGRDDNDEHSMPEVNEESMWMCSPVVYGFSFATKDWIRMAIDSIGDIKFSETAFDELIIPDGFKHIFVSCLTGEMPSLDAIEGKGNGKIFLLYGPPGCGKTMTAESVAECLRLPLYYVSVGELGTSPEDMENNLAEIMDVAQSWNAVVLLDEVDVFAVKRGQDIEVNAMTAILLRLLERYNGVMFMTTNLIDNLDPAFISRATACIEYKELEAGSRKVIWKSLLGKAAALGLTVDLEILNGLDHFADRKMNGREIKNCVRLAYSVAMSGEQKKLTKDTLSSVVGLSRSL